MTKKRHFSQEEKYAILMSAKDIGVNKAAEIAGLHYTTIYGWRGKLAAMGKKAFLAYESSRPGRGVKHITAEQEKIILEVWEKNPGYGPGQIRNQLRRQGITISIVTVRKIIAGNGYKSPKKSDKVKTYHRYEATRPLELAQMDILERYINKLKVYVILLIDDYSRFILGFRVLEETSVDCIIDLVDEAIQRYGKMGEILTDRGFVFYSWRGINRFEKWLEVSRVDHIHASPHHPQTLGKVESLNRRIQSELFKQQHFSTLGHAVTGVKEWVEHYNYHRPHQGIGGVLTPGERFHGQTRKVLDKISKGVNLEQKSNNINRSLLNISRSDNGQIILTVLGQSLVFQGGHNESGAKP
jgi:transposase InsO family protein